MFTARALSAFLAVTILLYGLSFTTPTVSSDASSKQYSSSSPTISTRISTQLKGTYVKAPDGTEVVFQKAKNPHGSILFFHGCSHSATDFFPSSLTCPHCLGLPEELHLVRAALNRNLSPIAVSSTDRSRKCWRSNRHLTGPDYDRVISALEVATKYGLPTKLLYTVGASSGGYFATSFATKRSPFSVSATHAIVASAALQNPESPTCFVHMGHRDTHTAMRVKTDVTSMREKNVPTIEFSVRPLPITEQFLQNAFPNWDYHLIKDVRNSLLKHNVIDEKSNLIKIDPRKSNWRNSVSHLKQKMNDTLIADQSPLSEEMNRAFSMHEMTADHFDEVLDFFEKHSKL